MKTTINERTELPNGISLSIQANEYAYCSPRITTGGDWDSYDLVEVGYITDSNGDAITPPASWAQYAESGFPSDIYAYIPVYLVKEFMDTCGAAYLD